MPKDPAPAVDPLTVTRNIAPAVDSLTVTRKQQTHTTPVVSAVAHTKTTCNLTSGVINTGKLQYNKFSKFIKNGNALHNTTTPAVQSKSKETTASTRNDILPTTTTSTTAAPAMLMLAAISRAKNAPAKPPRKATKAKERTEAKETTATTKVPTLALK